MSSDQNGIKLKPVMITNLQKCIWKLNIMSLNNPQIKGGITGELRKDFELGDNENTTYQQLWDSTKTVIREKFTVSNSYIRERERFKIGDPNFYLQKLEKEYKD